MSRPSGSWLDLYHLTGIRPQWCPKGKECQPAHNEFGKPESHRGFCAGVDMFTNDSSSKNAPDCLRLCIMEKGAAEPHTTLMTLDEAARLGGGLALMAGQGLMFLDAWRKTILAMD